MLRRIFLCVCLILTSLALPTCVKRWTHGFKLSKMQLDLLPRKEWDVISDLGQDELLHILNQPYHYLDRGVQCYVFESEDRQYVIKFFRFDHRRAASNKYKISPMQKIERMFRASILAYTRAKEETGVLYLHLNQTVGQLPVLCATGPTYQKMSLNLDAYRFVIQKRADPFRSALLKAYAAKDDQAMREMIDSFLQMLKSRVAKGLRNSDPSMSRNFGFLHRKAIEIDFGSYSTNGTPANREMARYVHKLRCFLTENAPEWVSYLDQQAI